LNTAGKGRLYAALGCYCSEIKYLATKYLALHGHPTLAFVGLDHRPGAVAIFPISRGLVSTVSPSSGR
jgi:hypothetical protein